MKNRVIVVVPMYQIQLNHMEQISLEQCWRELGGEFPICIVVPEKLKNHPILKKYLGFLVESFDDEWFGSVASYSKLLLREEFYERFKSYEYVLIHRLDVFVFENKIDFFCDMQYDYIGAPWIDCNVKWMMHEDGRQVYVGNGGFSLRNVNNTIELLKCNKQEALDFEGPEDVFFSSMSGKDYKVASIEVALQFAFERNVSKCYALNNYRLPSAVHAWARHDLEFWHPYIEGKGYEINDIRDEKTDLSCKYFFLANRYLCGEWSAKTYLRILFGEAFNKIIIWGAGECGERIIRWLNKESIDIKYVIDSDENKQGKKLYGINITAYRTGLVDVGDKMIIAIRSSSVVNEIHEILQICTGQDIICFLGSILVSQAKKLEKQEQELEVMHYELYGFSLSNDMPRNSKVIVYGAGRKGCGVYHWLEKNSDYNVVGIVDKRFEVLRDTGLNVRARRILEK